MDGYALRTTLHHSLICFESSFPLTDMTSPCVKSLNYQWDRFVTLLSNVAWVRNLLRAATSPSQKNTCCVKFECETDTHYVGKAKTNTGRMQHHGACVRWGANMSKFTISGGGFVNTGIESLPFEIYHHGHSFFTKLKTDSMTIWHLKIGVNLSKTVIIKRLDTMHAD